MSKDGNITNLLGMARTAALGGNQEEALDYYNRVLEVDPAIVDAWVGKGRAAGWMSSLANIRTGEVIIAFGHAIANADDASKQAVVSEVVSEANSIIVALYGMARNNLVDFPGLDSTWESYLLQVSQLLDALEAVKDWNAGDRVTLENIVHLCKDNIEGYSFRDEYNQNMPMAYSITPEYEAHLKSRMTDAIARLREIDPEYAAPAIEKKEADQCFIATASFGSLDHPRVRSLREFRDQFLLTNKFGRRFVSKYYKVGPIFAQWIRAHPSVRVVTRFMIVLPTSFIAKLLLLVRAQR